MKLIILPEIKENLLPLKDEELKALERSILEEGIRDELIVWDKNGELILVDGHHRYELAQKYNLEFKISKRQFSNLDEVLEWVDNNQLGRRNLTNEERSYLIGRMYLREKKQGERTDLVSDELGVNLTPSSGSHATAKKIAEKINSSEVTVRRAGRFAEAVDKVKEISPEVTEKILKGEVSDALTRLPTMVKEYSDSLPEIIEIVEKQDKSISQSIQEYSREKAKAKLEVIAQTEAEEINKLYDVIVIDPPWEMKKIEREVAPNQVEFNYPTMTLDEIKNIKLPTADNCHVWLWTTQKYLPEAFKILEDWGLKYVCTFVWHKTGGFQPFNLPQYNCEFALYARKGNPQFFDVKDFNTCFYASRSGHSVKPDIFYDTVKRVTAGKRLDMFSRRAIEGFDSWGKEAT